MPRKLKTYTTSAGFFDLAVAAPSMKAALEAWGSNSNLFQHGLATETGDPKIVAATMARPGVVLRRPVGTDRAFTENATLPSNFAAGLVGPPSAKRDKPADKPSGKPAAEPIDEPAARKAALAFQREREQRRRQEQKEEAARTKERERRDRAIATAEAALEDAEQAHQKKMDELDKARSALDRKLEAERERWRQKKEELERALQDARS